MKLANILFAFVFVCTVYADEQDDVEEAFASSQIVPDVIPAAPKNLLKLSYAEKDVDLGNEITPTEAGQEPSVSYNSNPDTFYSVILADPDAPSREDPIYKNFRHWLAINIPGTDLSKADNISSYVPPAPPAGSGFHRYTFLVYQQPDKITVSDVSTDRPNFSVTDFADQFNLGSPIAGNFFLGQAES